MKEIKLNLDKSNKYVVACSFGPDSMALLDAAIKEKLDIVVAHVNYRKREEALFEQQALEKYCQDRNIKIYVLDLLGEKHSGNFQEWAREKRYQFFSEVVMKEDAYAVLVAHQEDDLIETYLMQKTRGNLAKTPGISENIVIFGVKIIRPLLSYSKHELQRYDEKNNVPFSIDKSNLSDDYTRNLIRHSTVEKLTSEERDKLLGEIKAKSNEQIRIQTKFSKEEFLSLGYEDVVRTLDWAMQKCKEHRNISQKFVEEIKKAFKSKTNHSVRITEKVLLELDYDEVYLVNLSKLENYIFEFESIFKNAFLDIDFSMGAEDRGIDKSTQSYIVKNINKNDTLIIKNYSATIRRLFIDWKMPHYLRKVWPGIYDKNGNLIYVPRYRKVFKDDHTSKFKINIDYFREF